MRALIIISTVVLTASPAGAEGKAGVDPASQPSAARPTSRASARRGTLAVINTRRRGARGWRQAQKAHEALTSHLGGWAKMSSVAAALVGAPQRGVLPNADEAKRLGPLLQRVRSARRPSLADLYRLGMLIDVDYLLLVRGDGASRFSARLFSVNRQEYAPEGFERLDGFVTGVERYVAHQVRGKAKKSKLSERWWVWAIAGTVAVVTVILSALDEGESSGPLKVRVHR